MKAKPTRPARKSAPRPAEKSWRKSRCEPLPQPHGGALVPGAGRGPAPGAPNAGRPRKEVRRLIIDILMNEGVAAAREVLRGEPDKAGRVPDHAQRLAWFCELSEIGLNMRVKLARIEASAAGATLQTGVQIILQGGPAGNEQPVE